MGPRPKSLGKRVGPCAFEFAFQESVASKCRANEPADPQIGEIYEVGDLALDAEPEMSAVIFQQSGSSGPSSRPDTLELGFDVGDSSGQKTEQTVIVIRVLKTERCIEGEHREVSGGVVRERAFDQG